MKLTMLRGSCRAVFLFTVLVTAIGCDRGDRESTRSTVMSQSPSAPRKGAPQEPEIVANQAQTVTRTIADRRRYADTYSMLAEQAESGNAMAAFQLYEDVLRCSSIQARKESLEDLAAVSRDKVLEANVVRELAQDRAVCAGLSKNQLASKEYWVTKAARLGHVGAQVAYFSVATEKFDTPQKVVANAEEFARIKSEALVHLTSAASRGDRTALFNLANTYQEGTLAKRDPVKAYAYMRALQQRGGVEVSAKYLDLWGRELTAEQIRSAEAMSAGAVNRSSSR
ncbi:hypothetical protein [Lysobacter sp. TAB13]|uniref:hypothetical protein n=1 Tax=Lysobacter sp. TAB13 TaxID=3233065 RepID=UPI003F9E61AD